MLEALKRTQIETKTGQKVRLLDQIDVITGVSGGSFTALAYRLYGDRLFDEYEKRFLERDVQGDITSRTLNPANWGALSSTGWGRSELAANLYDEILFEGATFGDLRRSNGPYIAVSATDITSGSRVIFTPQNFDFLCSDLDSFRIARAAAASSAVPVVLSPLTINNYGGSCGFKAPPVGAVVREQRRAAEAGGSGVEAAAGTAGHRQRRRDAVPAPGGRWRGRQPGLAQRAGHPQLVRGLA